MILDVFSITQIIAKALFGLQLTMAGAGNPGDKFQIKLNSEAAENISLTTGRGEDLALASPIRTADDINNTGK